MLFQYQAYNAGKIPCPFPLSSGEHNPDWLEGVQWWKFPEVGVCLKTIEPLGD